ncbi:hypothetical protein [Effusibacillus lacus]|uniref:Uncharacterized protein n=1 Tax=Effusibacillus lacus TaxID=1348429 RepID=A0A292YHK4_9BACL|nr:hypothetical protein [Effusibacillus lacus]TCS68545.1 hypothetical protein EDD64_14228 [Effusibacillus lacus]GAX88426.1 hypothetical protein EFBL_0035 [Effusibacillus lacus]
MKINVSNLKKLVESHYTTMIIKHYGSEGMSYLRDLLTNIHDVFKYISTEVTYGPIVIFSNVTVEDVPFDLKESITIYDLSMIAQYNLTSFTLQILPNGQYLLWRETPDNLTEYSKNRIVYLFEHGTESFWANGDNQVLPKLINSYGSMFCIPTFNDLNDALEHYKSRMVRQSSCEILSGIWFDEKRLFFKNSPETIIRKSLTNFLKASLRGDVEVRPEQIVDETHPVDIKVTWMFTNRLALIEIKWLGKSLGEDGKIKNDYTDYRAREGAKQLAEYLDSNKIQAPLHVTRGYLVIIDGRRRGLNESTKSIDTSKGLFYESREINFDPPYHEHRDDFHRPFRMFVEPICS